MKRLLLLAALTVSSLPAVSQTNNGIIEGRVTRLGSSEGIADIPITLLGPGAVDPASAIRAFYTPNPNLTPAMRAEIDANINGAPPHASIESLVTFVRRYEAQMLGLPAPPAPPASQESQGRTVVSDRDGRFSFRNLSPGRYWVFAQRVGYFGTPAQSETLGTAAPTTVSTFATVVAGQQTPPVAIVLLRAATITGTVRDPNGQPVIGVQVDAFQTTYQNGREMLRAGSPGGMSSMRTDDRGQYRLYGLPPGEYRIAATPRRSTNAGTQDTYARTFYPNVVDARTAQTIEAAEGSEVGGIDIVIRPDAIGRILGQVVSSIAPGNAQGGPPSTLYLISADPKTLTDTSTSSVNISPATGKFEIRGVVPGEYELVASTPDGKGGLAWGRTRVNVGSVELTGVTLDIHPGVDLKVLLNVDGETPLYRMRTPTVSALGDPRGTAQAMAPVPIPNFRILLDSAERLTNAPFVPTYTTFDPSGVFLFRNVIAGKYSVSVSPLPANGYVSDVRAGGRSVFDSGVDVNSQTGEVQVLVKTNSGKIRGVVLDSTRKPVSSARVALVPPVSRRQNSQLYKVSFSDASGSFSMKDIAPGEYKLFSWETAPDGSWMDNRFLDLYEGLGRTIVVDSNTTEIELKLIPKQGGQGRNR